MTKKLENIISFSLVIIFMLPPTIKLLDEIFHHHHHFICTAKHEHHFHEHHDKCAIVDFELSFFSMQKLISEKKETISTDKLFVNLKQSFYFVKSDYSFLLRASPF